MIIYFSVVLKDLFNFGRDYPWPKPDRCPCCNGCRLWGHGFVSACFDGYDQLFWLKRYRCPDCRCVMRLRPEGYFKGFQASIATIRSSVVSKARAGRWIPGIGRTRQCHWWCKEVNFKGQYASHSLRKTFGYHQSELPTVWPCRFFW